MGNYVAVEEGRGGRDEVKKKGSGGRGKGDTNQLISIPSSS